MGPCGKKMPRISSVKKDQDNEYRLKKKEILEYLSRSIYLYFMQRTLV